MSPASNGRSSRRPVLGLVAAACAILLPMSALAQSQSVAVDLDPRLVRLIPAIQPGDAPLRLSKANYQAAQGSLVLGLSGQGPLGAAFGPAFVCVPRQSQSTSGSTFSLRIDKGLAEVGGPVISAPLPDFSLGFDSANAAMNIVVGSLDTAAATCYWRDNVPSIPLAPRQEPLCGEYDPLTTTPDPQVLFSGSFEEDVEIRLVYNEFVQVPDHGDYVRYRFDIRSNSLSGKAVSVALREWFPAQGSPYSRRLGTGAQMGEVSELKCSGHHGALCDGMAEKFWTKEPAPQVMALDDASLPGGGCLRLDGRRKLFRSSGAAFPHGFGVTVFGAGDQNLVRWAQIPIAPPAN